MGTIIRETIGTIGTAQEARLESGVHRHHRDLFRHHPQARRRADERLLLGLHGNYPYEDDAEPEVRDWFTSYKDKYNEDPTVFSVYGYQLIDLFAHRGEGPART